MLRPVHLALLLLMVVLVATLEEKPNNEPAQAEIEPPANKVNDLDADASGWGYSTPWRYGWRNGGWGGWRSGWGLGGRVWTGRGGWW
ncbi:uncharacterized protein LOC128874534 isoform X1 [Hylaeus volcanicus]|uniref:uncharacterized protein LOC128874534 isoform X1 n=1 Tax=Hylaeus volcanicus TaxID=313075 RepID=UPI0023B85737|nr:uncharacterized protein LOC128874534 isoform X1 [Hylaeus volcanicus]